MKLKYISILLIIIFMSSGCSLIKSIQRSETTTYKETSISKENEQKNTQPKAENSSTDRKQGGQKKPSTPTTPPKEEPNITHEPEKVVPIIKFSDLESANVQIPFNVNNPFPPSDELVIPLPELRDDFCYPYMGNVISQYGKRGRSNHTGVDIKAIPKDTIRAAFSGVVRMSKPYSGYGNIIVLRHYNGIETVYAHQTKNLVKVNDVVKAGEAIGLAGRTGTATTEHLHFELRVASEHINPNLLIDTDKRDLRNDTLYFYKKGSTVVAYNHHGGTTGIALASIENPMDDANNKTTTNRTVSSSSSSKSTSPQYHSIRQGDTLSKLARTYSTTVSKICNLNNINANKILKLKEKLRVK